MKTYKLFKMLSELGFICQVSSNNKDLPPVTIVYANGVYSVNGLYNVASLGDAIKESKKFFPKNEKLLITCNARMELA